VIGLFVGCEFNMRKIAIVDDALDSRDFLYYLLRDDYEIARYGSGDEALREFVHTVPDLVIMDIRLHGMDGIEVLNRIRQDDALRRTPVIALTANAMSGDRQKYLDAGFDEYISKPIVDVEVLFSAIRKLIS
jgi:CheY-like chemotaxis protein